MQVRRFEFSGPSGETIDIAVSCREPPEAQQGKTLTWQIDDRPSQRHAAGQAADPTLGDAAGAPSPPPLVSAPDLIGLDIWPASIALCHYLASHPHLATGQRVMELGAGEPLLRRCSKSWLPLAPKLALSTLAADAAVQAWACPACCAPSWVLPLCC